MSGTLVCVGNITTNGCITSPDAITWTSQAGLASKVWQGVCYAPSLAKFCTVGNTTQTATSSDGVTWASGTISAHYWNDVCWSPSLSRFAAVSQDGFAAYSSDGLTWSAATVPEANTWTNVVWADALNLFVAISNTGTHQVMTSPDGITWTARTHAVAGSQGVAWDPVLALLCAWSSTSYQSSTSTDGITWTAHATSGLANGNLHRGTYLRGSGGFLIGGHNGTLFKSANGSTWTQISSPLGGFNDTYDIKYSAGLGLYVCCGNANSPAGYDIGTSPDGTTWTSRTSGTGQSGNGHAALADSSVPPPGPTSSQGTLMC